MLFVTNRSPRQSVRFKKNRDLSFDLQNTDVSRYIYFCKRHDKDKYTEIGSKDFFQSLKDDLDDDTQLLLYIHGFNNNMEEQVFRNAEKLQALLDKEDKDRVRVIPLIWPCDDDSIVAIADDYWDDRRAADASANGFARLLGKFDAWRRQQAQQQDPCYRRINLLAHSMGNRVLRGALNEWAIKESGGQMPSIFRNVFMAAPDIKNEALEKNGDGQFIPDSARNVFVYYAYDDFAMPASKVANVGEKTLSRRLGMTGPENLDKTPRNVYELNCSSFNNRFDPPVGHGYFLEDDKGVVSPVLLHMLYAIQNGRPPHSERSIELDTP
ncbi:MAG: alpha/beta hydrolase [Pseudomonadales bacterium]|nr:alpha/beta hydrolase [Pseudomonadales bacterium]